MMTPRTPPPPYPQVPLEHDYLFPPNTIYSEKWTAGYMTTATFHEWRSKAALEVLTRYEGGP